MQNLPLVVFTVFQACGLDLELLIWIQTQSGQVFAIQRDPEGLLLLSQNREHRHAAQEQYNRQKGRQYSVESGCFHCRPSFLLLWGFRNRYRVIVNLRQALAVHNLSHDGVEFDLKFFCRFVQMLADIDLAATDNMHPGQAIGFW